MNLYELNEMIQILLDENDPDNNDELISFYLRKRDELVLEIEKKIKEGLKNV